MHELAAVVTVAFVLVALVVEAAAVADASELLLPPAVVEFC